MDKKLIFLLIKFSNLLCRSFTKLNNSFNFVNDNEF